MADRGQPVVTMSTLGKKGRFGNQVFQYAFLKIYAKVFNIIEAKKLISYDPWASPPLLNRIRGYY